jgi:outer membrane receptor protein involved in Fe transport
MSKKRDSFRASTRALMAFGLGVAGAITATPALAQDDDTEIVVTATRRDQSLQDVAIAVTPVTAEMIANAGIRDVQDLTSVAPALQFNVSESESSATARLRGVGTQGSNPGLESAVGIFVDGVYRARNGVALSDLGDVAQIEVLRGPQGTLFGRNTSAGLITINTRAPDLSEFGASAEATYGEFNETRVAASVNLPLVEDVVALSFFASKSDRDGFLDMNPDGRNTLLGPSRPNDGVDEANTRGAYNLRGQMLWQITDDLDFRFIADYSERDESCCAAQIYDPALLNGNPVTNLNTLGVEGAPIPYGFGRQQWVANLGGYGPGVSVSDPLGAQGDGDIGERTGFSNYGYTASLQDYGVSGEFNLELGGATLTSITAYRNWSSAGGSDSDYSQADIVYVPQGDDVGTEFAIFTQELRLAGEFGRLDWLLGVFYSDETIDRDFSFQTGSQYGAYFAGLDSIISGGTVAPGLGVAPVGGSLSTLYNGLALVPANVGSFDHYLQEGESLALFTHNIFALTDRTDLTVGLRYTSESKSLTADFYTPFSAAALRSATVSALEVAFAQPAGTFAPYNNCNPTVAPAGPPLSSVIAALRSGYCVPWLRNELDAVGYDQSRTDEEWSGVVSLRHEFTDNISAYASASRGYKGGGFNLDRNFDFTYQGGAPSSDFDAELVDAYEIGVKTDWFNGDLLLNLAVYQNEYSNFQLNTYNGIQFVVTTVPEVTSEGAELDLIWRTPIEGLSINGGVAYTDATYGPDDGWVLANRNPITGEQTLARLPNSQLTNAPQWTATTSFTYNRPLFNGALMGLAYVDARYVDDQSTGSDLRPSKLQPSYTLFNARVGLGTPDERWSLELWARNLTDEEYVQVAFDAPLQQGTAGPTQGAFLGDPRTYGITLRARY